MKLPFYLKIILLFIFLCFIGCNKSVDNEIIIDEVVIGGVSRLTVPDSGRINQDIGVLYFTYGNSSAYSYIKTEIQQTQDTVQLKSLWHHVEIKGYDYADVIVEKHLFTKISFSELGKKYVIGVGSDTILTDSIIIYE